MFKIATLLRNKKDKSLDVCVENQDFENKQDAKTIITDTQEKIVIGMICFQDERDARGIVFDFAETYKACKRMGTDYGGKYYFVRYEPEFEITIPLSFVNYFSGRI